MLFIRCCLCIVLCDVWCVVLCIVCMRFLLFGGMFCVDCRLLLALLIVSLLIDVCCFVVSWLLLFCVTCWLLVVLCWWVLYVFWLGVCCLICAAVH